MTPRRDAPTSRPNPRRSISAPPTDEFAQLSSRVSDAREAIDVQVRVSDVAEKKELRSSLSRVASLPERWRVIPRVVDSLAERWRARPRVAAEKNEPRSPLDATLAAADRGVSCLSFEFSRVVPWR